MTKTKLSLVDKRSETRHHTPIIANKTITEDFISFLIICVTRKIHSFSLSCYV